MLVLYGAPAIVQRHTPQHVFDTISTTNQTRHFHLLNALVAEKISKIRTMLALCCATVHVYM